MKNYCCHTPRSYINDITVVPSLNGTDGVIDYTVESIGGATDITVYVIDEDGVEVATTDGASGQIILANANLWEPLNAYLYTLHVELKEALRCFKWVS